MDPRELIRHANRLITVNRGAPRQVELRRAVSACYYALFHCFLRTAANDLIGVSAPARKSAAYALVYRAFDHSDMRRTCQDAVKSSIPARLTAATGLSAFPQEIQVAARVFIHLQDMRHKADYSPNLRLFKSDANTALSVVEFAIAKFEDADDVARRLFLLCMLFKIR